MHKEDKRDFDIVADTWDEEPRRVKLAEEVTAAIRREVSLTCEMEALDYGCGSGLVSHLYGISPAQTVPRGCLTCWRKKCVNKGCTMSRRG
jgi:hypothetical protein